MQALQIGQVASRTGLTVDTIRFYEKSGLLIRPSRTNGGFRQYHEREVADLEFIQKAQQLGFSLAEIRELFTIRRHPDQACEHVRDVVTQKLVVVRNKIAELHELEVALDGALKQCRKALRKSVGHQDLCPVLAEITAALPKANQR